MPNNGIYHFVDYSNISGIMEHEVDRKILR